MPAGKATPLPMKKLVTICLIMLCGAMAVSLVFPFVGFQVQDFGVTQDPTKVGYYAGFIAGAFSFGQALCSWVFGWASDAYGRRPILIFGMVGTLISILAFGASQSYTMALLTRFLHGTLSGNIAVCKTYLSEITDASNQARGMSSVGLTWGIGLMIGPTVGGWLCRPALKYPALFSPDGFWAHYPYLLPCFFAAALNLVGLVLGIFVLEETHPLLKPKPRTVEASTESSELAMPFPMKPVNEDGESLDPEDDEETGLLALNTENAGSASPTEFAPSPQVSSSPDSSPELKPGSLDRAITVQIPESQSKGGNAKPLASARTVGGDETMDESFVSIALSDSALKTPMTATSVGQKPGFFSRALRPWTWYKKEEQAYSMVGSEGPSSAGGVTDLDGNQPIYDENHPDVDIRTIWTMLFSKSVLKAMAMYFLVAYTWVIFDEVLSLWMLLPPEQGGLGFETNLIGTAQGIGGVMLVLGQMTVYTPLVNRIGPQRAIMWGSRIALPIVCAWPALGMLAGTPSYIMWPLLSMGMCVRAVAALLQFTSTFMVISNSVPAARLGALNGVSQTIAAVGRTIGPALGGVILAWSLQTDAEGSKHIWPFNVYAVYTFQGFFLILIHLLAQSLPPHVNMVRGKRIGSSMEE